MASTVPAKSNNPLHNFDLPHLKWKKNHHHSNNNNHHQRRRSTKICSDSSSPSRHDSPSQSPMHCESSPMRDSAVAARRSPMHRESSPMRDSVAAAIRSPMRESITTFLHSSVHDSVPPRQSPMRDSVPARQSPMRCESVNESDKDISVIEYRRHSRISSAPESSTKKRIDDNKKHNKVVEIEGRSKILLKIPQKNKVEETAIHEEQQKCDESQEEGKAITADEEATKTWNLRPRRPIHKSLNLNGGPFRSTGSAMQESKSQLPNMNVNKPENNESNAAQKKEKRRRFSVALSREEIDEDIYAMTGSKAARRPKKRVKALQKQLDTLFPGLWLASITLDSYKVCENLPKSDFPCRVKRNPLKGGCPSNFLGFCGSLKLMASKFYNCIWRLISRFKTYFGLSGVEAFSLCALDLISDDINLFLFVIYNVAVYSCSCAVLMLDNIYSRALKVLPNSQ
ncbi:hypothetical protein RND71_035050 [Anisodus tanguticus]|uniref:Uncharacterized protein n=1 Tax=Anisodus tanguticus TaxID=243964 RepID=A0AAE1V169_9SOLA|nr:hypothetical protein RND71_035050 [Anisodus tanguticus]